MESPFGYSKLVLVLAPLEVSLDDPLFDIVRKHVQLLHQRSLLLGLLHDTLLYKNALLSLPQFIQYFTPIPERCLVIFEDILNVEDLFVKVDEVGL